MPSFCKVGPLSILLLLSSMLALRLPAQELPSASSLARLSQKAGYIFAGTVTAVERITPASTGEVATVRVSFRVDQAVRGVQAGETLTIREWAGLWEAGERYRPGQRLVLFLYPSSKLGLTSPVGGPLGRFSVDGDGYVDLEPPQSSTGLATRDRIAGKKRVSSSDWVRAIRRAQEK